jgi:succinyl-diaminopimelate desuccinylase
MPNTQPPAHTIDPVALLQALIRCDSVTPADNGALGIVEAALATLGFTAHRLTFQAPKTPDIDNLYARRGTNGPNLCFAGHTDVVPAGDLAAWTHPPFAAEIHHGVLYGRGAVDMKGSIACFIAACSRAIAANPKLPGSLSFLITGDEEGPSINGTTKVLDWLAQREERLSACLVGEPSNPHALGDEIKIGRRGSVNGEIVVHGKQGHAAYPAKAENPVPKLVRILDRLSSQKIDSGTPNFEASNLEVTVIDIPNRATNVIPNEARATFNVRYNDLHTRPAMEAWIALQVEAAASSINARYDLTFSGTGDVFLTKPGTLVETLSAAIFEITGRTPALTTGGGTSDARFIQAYCPVVEFGLVNATIHQIDECVPVADLEALTQIYQRFIEGYFAST